MRDYGFERPPVQRKERAVLLGPAEAGGRQRKRRRGWRADHFIRREAAHERRAYAEKEWIAGGEHADRRAAPRFDGVERLLDRRGPRQCLGGDRPDQRKVPLAPNDERRLRDKPARGRGKPVNAVFAEADDGQPSRLAHGAAL